MKRNESNQDRGIRAVVGIIALLIGLFAVGGFLRALLIIVGLNIVRHENRAAFTERWSSLGKSGSTFAAASPQRY